MDSSEIQKAAPVLAKSIDQDHTEVNGEKTTEVKDDTQSDCNIAEVKDSLDDSNASSDSDMESYEDFEEVYKAKIEQLLHDIGLKASSVECIQHGDIWQNCVYALKSINDSNEQYILRVPVLPEFRESDGVCEAIENDAAVLRYLADKLPVPRVKAYSVFKNNVLNKPYTIQTRLPGMSLNEIWDELNVTDKMAITDQFVELLANIQSFQFTTAGIFTPPPSLATSTSDCAATPSIKIFHKDVMEDLHAIEDLDAQIVQERTGPNLKALLTSHIHGWIAQEEKKDKSFVISSLHFLLAMIEELDHEGAFKNTPFPIVLHHWDLEARNIMVEKTSDDRWKICGVIDWDGAHAIPRPLARKPHDWIWDYDCEGFTGYFDNDHHPNLLLSEEQLALKTHFDTKAAAALDAYLEDAYGHGRWLRRIWLFAKNGLGSMWYLDLAKELERDWKARPKVEAFPSSGSKAFFERALHWALSLESRMCCCF